MDIDIKKKEEYKFDWLTNEEFAFIHKTVNLLLLIVEPRVPNGFINPTEDFFDIWVQTVIDHKIDHELAYCHDSWENAYADLDIWEEDMSETERAHSNAMLWIKDARRDFSNRMKPFYSKLADESIYLKHFANVQWSNERVIQESHSRAILLPSISLDVLDQLFTIIIDEFLEEIYAQEFNTFIIRTEDIVGYSKRRPCTTLLYKLDYTANIFHAYPIEESEIAGYTITSSKVDEDDGKEYKIDNIIDFALSTLN